MQTLGFNVTVIMEQYPTHNRWQPQQWRAVEVLPDEGMLLAPAVLNGAAGTRRIAHPGLQLGIFRDEGEGYYLNIHAPEPAIFVIWRLDEAPTDADMEAIPHSLTLSYNEAARRMDAQEKVDRVPMPRELLETLREWVDANYQPPQKKQRIRPASFQRKEGRKDSPDAMTGNPVDPNLGRRDES